MDSSPVLDYSLQYQWCSDSDMSSLSSPSLSPVSSMDSSLSPSYRQLPQPSGKTSNAGYSQKAKSGRKLGRARTTKIRSKQRESASEKEKLRMRDLTKALHHLRSFLPPSVAPAGQTLTKIETLRLTIRYISYLSSQLGLSEEVLFQRREEQGDLSAHDDATSPDLFSYFQPKPMKTQNVQGLNLNQNISQNFYSPQPVMVHPGNCGFGMDQYSREYSEVPQRDVRMDCVLQSPPASQPSYQV
ncbi:mesoderm posterior protein 2-like [Eucyclogobius newberryi]|uniref:mesoderm posterior protein 2-like n=1 Tax=Eucyclogobius newberryi TaxID=166745 RepID=UPI003B5BD75D